MSQTRRSFAVLLGAGLAAGCATARTPGAAPVLSAPLQPRGKPLVLAPVAVEADRVARVVVGLRPFRPSGFVVRAEAMDGKPLVHNYGHGGGGITLSWGTSELAVELGFAGSGRPHAVLGCGVVGLSTARLLQRRGAEVTIYAKALPPDTTSNIAGGQWWPSSVFDHGSTTQAFDAQFERAARLSYRQYQTMLGGPYGVRWTRNYLVSGRPIRGGQVQPPIEDLAREVRELAPGEHPFGAAHVQQYDTLMIEPQIYLQAVMEDFLTAGGRIVVREFNARAEVAALPEAAVFNCTGLGSRELFGDQELIPVRGQLVALLPQPEVTYNVLSGGLYMFPRQDGVMLGGTFDRENWSVEPDPAVTARILAGHKALFSRMRI